MVEVTAREFTLRATHELLGLCFSIFIDDIFKELLQEVLVVNEYL
jgi:hypothetical protein